MARELAVAYVSIVPSTKQLAADLTGTKMATIARDAGDVAGKNMSASLGSSLKAKIAAIGIGALVAQQLKQGFDEAVGLAEANNKVAEVFEGATESVQKFASQGASALGMSKRSALEAAGTFGNLLTATGMNEDQAADLSTTMVQLAADLASFNNTPVDDALLALRSGLAGETEPLKRFGVNLNDAILKAKAFQLGLMAGSVDAVKVQTATANLSAAQEKYNTVMEDGTASAVDREKAAAALAKAEQDVEKATSGVTGEMTPAIKAQAAYATIMEQTAKAQGDFERTADGVANKQKILAARWEDTRTKLMAGFVPAAERAMNMMDDLLVKWEALSTKDQNNIITGTAVTIGAIAVVTSLGKIATAIQAITTATQTLAASKAAVIASNPWTLAIAGLALVLTAAYNGGRAMEEYAASHTPAKQAAEQLRDANRSLSAAMDAVAASEDRMKGVRLGVEQATINMQRADLRLADAEVRLADARASGSPTEITQAELDLQQARLDQAGAWNDLVAAEKAVDEERARGAASAAALYEAEGKVQEKIAGAKYVAATTSDAYRSYMNLVQTQVQMDPNIAGADAQKAKIEELEQAWLKAYYANQRYDGATGGRRAPSSTGRNQLMMASGGFVSRATSAIIGEAGPEVVVPLSASRRSRAYDLLAEAADRIGVPAAAAQPLTINITGSRQDANALRAAVKSVLAAELA